MADRLYLGPVSKQLRGNREDALTLEREARIKVGYLFDSMMKGQTFKTGSWSLGDGRKIMAFVWNDVLGKRATVRLVGVGREDIYVIEFVIEHGWIPWAADSEFPAYVYAPELTETTVDDLVFSSLPTKLKITDETDYAFTDAITLDNEKKFSSVIWKDSNPGATYGTGRVFLEDQITLFQRTTLKKSNLVYAPESYTGLMRLWMQAKIGARNLEKAGIPAGWLVPGGVGLIRTALNDSLQWWFIRANSSGVFALRMIVPEEAAPLIGMLKSIETDVPSEEQDAVVQQCVTLESWIFSLSTVSQEDPIELLSSAAMEGAYLERGPLCWGWYFAPQTFGTTGETKVEAACAMWNGSSLLDLQHWYYTTYESHRAKIVFDVSVEIPTAEVAVDMEGIWFINNTLTGSLSNELMIPAGQNDNTWTKAASAYFQYWQFPAPILDAIDYTDGIVVAWYDWNGDDLTLELQVPDYDNNTFSWKCTHPEFPNRGITWYTVTGPPTTIGNASVALGHSPGTFVYNESVAVSGIIGLSVWGFIPGKSVLLTELSNATKQEILPFLWNWGIAFSGWTFGAVTPEDCYDEIVGNREDYWDDTILPSATVIIRGVGTYDRPAIFQSHGATDDSMPLKFAPSYNKRAHFAYISNWDSTLCPLDSTTWALPEANIPAESDAMKYRYGVWVGGA